jgi:hypothetical protein
MEKMENPLAKLNEKIGFVLEGDYINEFSILPSMFSGKREYRSLDKFLDRCKKKGDKFSEEEIEKNKEVLDKIDPIIDAINEIIEVLKRTMMEDKEYPVLIKKVLDKIYQVFVIIYGEEKAGDFFERYARHVDFLKSKK